MSDVSYMPIPALRKPLRGPGGRFARRGRLTPEVLAGVRDPTIPPDAFERTDLAIGRTRVWQGTDGTLYVRTPEGDA